MTKRSKELKSPEQRAQEVEKLLNQLKELGLPEDTPAIQEFTAIAKQFEQDGESISGKIRLYGFKRDLKYLLSRKLHIASNIVLEYNPYA
jgi:hypothetical protein